jgi:hypothetical protein
VKRKRQVSIIVAQRTRSPSCKGGIVSGPPVLPLCRRCVPDNWRAVIVGNFLVCSSAVQYPDVTASRGDPVEMSNSEPVNLHLGGAHCGNCPMTLLLLILACHLGVNRPSRYTHKFFSPILCPRGPPQQRRPF